MGLFDAFKKKEIKNNKKNSDKTNNITTSNNDDFNEMVENNLNGIKYEKQGKESKAVELYKMNVAKRFEGNHPYDRLAIYYRKNKDYDNEIKILETAIDVFTNDVPKARMDRIPKIKKFKERLKRAKELKAKK